MILLNDFFSNAGKSLLLNALNSSPTRRTSSAACETACATGAWDGKGPKNGTSWSYSGGSTSTARYSALCPQIEVVVQRAGAGTMAINVTQAERSDGGDFFFMIYRLPDHHLCGSRVSSMPLATDSIGMPDKKGNPAMGKSPFIGGKMSSKGIITDVEKGSYLVTLHRDINANIGFTVDVSLPGGKVLVSALASMDTILASEKAEPTESCRDIIDNLVYDQRAPMLLSADPLPEILERCTTNRTHFSDSSFVATVAKQNVLSMCGPTFVKAPRAGYVDGRVRSFRRASDLAPHCELFDSTIDPDDVKQGSLGNCWLISCIASLAGARPSVIRSIFGDESDDNTIANEVGVYSVRLWDTVKMDWCWIVVDDLIPLNAGGTPMFSSTRSGSEIWPMVLEKAFAKMAGSYENLRGSGGKCFCPTYLDMRVGAMSVMQVCESFDLFG